MANRMEEYTKAVFSQQAVRLLTATQPPLSQASDAEDATAPTEDADPETAASELIAITEMREAEAKDPRLRKWNTIVNSRLLSLLHLELSSPAIHSYVYTLTSYYESINNIWFHVLHLRVWVF